MTKRDFLKLLLVMIKSTYIIVFPIQVTHFTG